MYRWSTESLTIKKLEVGVRIKSDSNFQLKWKSPNESNTTPTFTWTGSRIPFLSGTTLSMKMKVDVFFEMDCEFHLLDVIFIIVNGICICKAVWRQIACGFAEIGDRDGVKCGLKIWLFICLGHSPDAWWRILHRRYMQGTYIAMTTRFLEPAGIGEVHKRNHTATGKCPFLFKPRTI